MEQKIDVLEELKKAWFEIERLKQSEQSFKWQCIEIGKEKNRLLEVVKVFETWGNGNIPGAYGMTIGAPDAKSSDQLRRIFARCRKLRQNIDKTGWVENF